MQQGVQGGRFGGHRHVDAVLSQHRGDGTVGLLGGHAALLDGTVGSITGREHAVHALDTAGGIDRNESVNGGRQAGDRPAGEHGKRDHAVDGTRGG